MMIKKFIKKYGEAIVWTAALIALFFMNPGENGSSLCVLKAMGIPWCPGCGIGHAIHYALHLNFAASLQEHILGIPASLIILFQTYKSIYLTNKNYKYEPAKHFNDVS